MGDFKPLEITLSPTLQRQNTQQELYNIQLSLTYLPNNCIIYNCIILFIYRVIAFGLADFQSSSSYRKIIYVAVGVDDDNEQFS